MLTTITSPTLLICEAKVRRNLQQMADRAKRHKLAFRPHAKTYQSQDVSNWIRELGVEEISVTSLRMANEFIEWGWEKLTIAMPTNPREFPEIKSLASKATISLFLTDKETALRMSREIPSPLGYFIELNAGYGRSGVDIKDLKTVTGIIEAAGHHHCRGFYVHSGHTYDALNQEEVTRIHKELLGKVAVLKAEIPNLAQSLIPGLVRGRLEQIFEFSIGDTPACSIQEDFTNITSIGPGNFVYYDLVQAGLGSCTTDDVAVCLAAPVVQVLPERGEAIVHAGWVQLGKDRLPDGTYGRLVRLSEDGSWSDIISDAAVIKLSQEHGTIRLPPAKLAELKSGDLVGILPVHACATVHGMRATGEQRIIPMD
jgi:D-serine deaminase-like pyridoxal phosphate-dependent protein